MTFKENVEKIEKIETQEERPPFRGFITYFLGKELEGEKKWFSNFFKKEEKRFKKNKKAIEDINGLKFYSSFKEFEQYFLDRLKKRYKTSNKENIIEQLKLESFAYNSLSEQVDVGFSSKMREELKKKRPSNKEELNMLFAFMYLRFRQSHPLLKKFKNKVTLYTGKTGTGKTYKAIQEGKKAGRFLYLAPCRQLAYETAIKYGEEGVNVLTGEAHIDGKEKEPVYAVYESAIDVNPEDFDMLLVDEFHYLSDPDRGWDLYNVLKKFQDNNVPIIGMTATNSLSSHIEDKLNVEEQKLKPFKEVPKKIKVNERQFYDNVRRGLKSIIFVKYTPGEEKRSDIAREADIPKERVKVLSAQTPPSERLQKQIDFMNGKIDLLLATNVLAQGLNFPAENILIEYNEYDSAEIIKQKMGRLGRPFQSDRKEVYYSVNKVPLLKKNKNIRANKRKKKEKCYFAKNSLKGEYKPHQIPGDLSQYAGFRYGKKVLEEVIENNNIKPGYEKEVRGAYKKIKEEEKGVEKIIKQMWKN